MPELPLEILFHILGFISNDINTLYRCALVNRRFCQAATKLLYKRVVFWPPFKPFLDLKARDGIYASESSVFLSSLLPSNGQHVESLSVGGFLSTRPPPTNLLPAKLTTAVRHYTNLRSVAFTPSAYYDNVFRDALEALAERLPLDSLEVNSSCCDESKAPILVKIQGLRVLTVRDPGRAVLQLMPEWLERLAPTLRQLHLKDNCGSITPGVIRSFIPHLQRIQEISLGLSYSLADADVFTFLTELPLLQSLQLQYYLQFNTPTRVPPFPHLRSFTVRHSKMDTRDDANRLCVWVHRVIASSPIERLVLICNTDMEEIPRSPYVSFDSLANHLALKHHTTLHDLDLGTGFVGRKSFVELVTRCQQLEYLASALARDTLVAFPKAASGLQKLHTVAFEIANSKLKNRRADMETAKAIFAQGPDSLRRITIDNVRWEGAWVSTPESQWEFNVNKVSEREPTWISTRE